MPSGSDTTTSSRNTPLSDYVKAYMDREEVSANRLAARSRDPETGQRLLVQWLINLANAQLTDKAPELWRLRALAAGMATAEIGGLDRGRFREQLDIAKKLTAAQWLEIEMTVLEVETSDGSIVTISVPPSLSEEKRREIRELAERMARMAADES